MYFYVHQLIELAVFKGSSVFFCEKFVNGPNGGIFTTQDSVHIPEKDDASQWRKM